MEQFRDIEGYEGLYQVSNEGNVKGLKREVEWNGTISHRPERILRPVTNGNGYLIVNLCKDGKQKMYRIHRLVAQTFIPNPEKLPQVNHKDECSTNNCVENLEWCTCEYNTNYGTRNQRIAEAMSIPIDMLTKDDELIRTFPSSMEAERWLQINGFPKAGQGNITNCCKGKLQSCYGFKWRYSTGN